MQETNGALVVETMAAWFALVLLASGWLVKRMRARSAPFERPRRPGLPLALLAIGALTAWLLYAVCWSVYFGAILIPHSSGPDIYYRLATSPVGFWTVAGFDLLAAALLAIVLAVAVFVALEARSARRVEPSGEAQRLSRLDGRTTVRRDVSATPYLLVFCATLALFWGACALFQRDGFFYAMSMVGAAGMSVSWRGAFSKAMPRWLAIVFWAPTVAIIVFVVAFIVRDELREPGKTFRPPERQAPG